MRSIFFGIVGCILIYWLLHETERLAAVLKVCGDILAPFIVGSVMAFILNVPMRGIERGLKKIQSPGKRRTLAIMLTVIAVLLVLVGIIWLVIPQVVETVESLVASLPGFLKRVWAQITEFLEKHPELQEWISENTSFQTIEWSAITEKIVKWATNSLSVIFNQAFNAVIGFANGIFNGVLSIAFCLYALARKEVLARQGRRILYSVLPEHFCDETIRILRMSNSTFSNFISGQCLEAVILGSMFAVSMTIFNMPYMPLVSALIVVTALVPIVGAFVGCVLGAFFILVVNPEKAFWFIIMFQVLQQIEGNLIYPRVVGSSIGLPGMWVLVAVAVGGDLMGIGGMLLMIPITAVLYTLAREFTSKRLSKRGIPADKLLDQPPELKSKFKEKRKQSKENREQKKTVRDLQKKFSVRKKTQVSAEKKDNES